MKEFNFSGKAKYGLAVLGVVFSAAIFLWVWNNYYLFSPQQVLIMTEKPVYSSQAELKLAIKNILPKKVCFSSCYPYYLEVKGEKWLRYNFEGNCSHEDLVNGCIEPDYGKFFLIDLPDLNKGLHRIRIPLDISAETGEEFREDKAYYSNDFIIR
jgi:hypothetical protein